MRKIKFLGAGDAQFTHRTRLLFLAAPTALKDRTTAAMENFFPGLAQTKQKFSVEFIEFSNAKEELGKGLKIIPYEVVEASGAPAYAQRIEGEGKAFKFLTTSK
ncbi:MAG: hypothetical protein ACP5Q3_14800 [bacterium]